MGVGVQEAWATVLGGSDSKRQADLWANMAGSDRVDLGHPCLHPVWVMPGLRRKLYGGGDWWSVLHLLLSLPLYTHPRTAEIPLWLVCPLWPRPPFPWLPGYDPHRTGKLSPPPMAQPCLRLLDRGQNPSTRSPGGLSEPIISYSSPDLKAVGLPMCRAMREVSAPRATGHAVGVGWAAHGDPSLAVK